MAQAEPQYFRDFSRGMITNVNPNLAPENASQLVLNMDADEELGSLVSRLGTGIVGSQLESGKNILGLHQHVDPTNSSNNVLFAVVNDSSDTNADIYDVENGTKSLEDDTAGLKTRFLTYLGETLRLNGTDDEKVYDGSWKTSGTAFDLDNIPTGYRVAIEWQDRVYLLNNDTNPDRIEYSELPSGSPLTVGWDTSSGAGNVDIEPEDRGGGLVGAGKVPGYVLFFKERSIHRWNFVSSFPERMVEVGTPSHESIISSAGMCAFFSATNPDTTGFYVTDGQETRPISHNRSINIKKWIDAIPTSYYSEVSGWGSDSHFFWSIGDVTVDGVDYTNVVVRYSVDTGEWVVRSYPSEFRVFASYINNNQDVPIAGDDDGNVIQIDKPDTYTDHPSSTPIKWEVMTHETNFGINQIKEISERVVADVRGAEKGMFIVDSNVKNERYNLGELIDGLTDLKINRSVKGNYFNIILRGQQKNGRATVREIELPHINVLPNYA